MTRKEAHKWLWALRWLLVDDGFEVLAGEVDFADVSIWACPNPWTLEDIGDFVTMYEAHGERRITKLKLYKPYEIRARAAFMAILRSIEA